MRRIRHTATLFFHDGIQIFEARDAIGSHYIAVIINPDGETDRYVVVEASPERLGELRAGILDLRSLLLERGEEWFLVEVGNGLEEWLILIAQEESLERSGYLPDAGFVLNENQPTG